jgi:hypothetical protein
MHLGHVTRPTFHVPNRLMLVLCLRSFALGSAHEKFDLGLVYTTTCSAFKIYVLMTYLLIQTSNGCVI